MPQTEKKAKHLNCSRQVSTTSSKCSVLRKKLRAEKLALELKIAEQTFANEIECLRAEQLQKRAKLWERQKRAEESRLEYKFEDAIAQEEGMSNKDDIDEELNEYLQTCERSGLALRPGNYREHCC